MKDLQRHAVLLFILLLLLFVKTGCGVCDYRRWHGCKDNEPKKTKGKERKT